FLSWSLFVVIQLYQMKECFSIFYDGNTENPGQRLKIQVRKLRSVINKLIFKKYIYKINHLKIKLIKMLANDLNIFE
ncbi:hypothetical protein, partial [Tepidibacter mesophilus]|uniref:hypothetical protein n=1 Tax=Tepidibacter mesophilus TaxID=655607 RepID=UPI001A9A56FD